MRLLCGKFNEFDKREILFEAGDEVEYIAYINKGTVDKEGATGTYTIGEGNFICHDDIYGGFYSCDYYVNEGCEILPIPASSPLDIVQFLKTNSGLHKDISHIICSLCKGLYDMYVNLYDIIHNFYMDLKDNYDTYLALCDNYDITAEDFNLPHNADIYELSIQAYGKNLLILKSLAGDPEKERNLSTSSGPKYLKLQIDIINKVYVTFDDMYYYLKELIESFASDSDSCLFSLVSDLNSKIKNDSSYDLLNHMKDSVIAIDERVKTELNQDLDIDYNRVNFYFLVAEQMDDTSLEDFSIDIEEIVETDNQPASVNKESVMEYEDCDMFDILLQLCNYAGYEKDQYDLLNTCVITFLNMPDKYSKEADARAFRKKFVELYYELYEAVFLKYANSNSFNLIVKMFLDYGLMDERLLTDMQINELLNVTPLNKDEHYKVYRMSDWLLRIYRGEDIPSKNEFDQEYVDYVREVKKNEALSAIEEKRLLEDNVAKVHYEIQNMLKYNTRLLNGSLLTFYPMLHMESFERSIESMVLTTEAIAYAVNMWKEFDYSIFYREVMYTNPAKKIDKEVIQKEMHPIFILFPIAGINGVMWQDISGKRSNSNGRFFFPAFFNGTLEETMLTMLGRYRWELCKTIQGVSWNNIQVPSLTSEFIDYIQFYRKNKELTVDKKDAIKSQLAKCHNNMRDFFVFDYIIWLKYESSGAMRLNKFSRRMLATYCPLAKKYRDKQASQPIYEEAMKRFNINRLKKIKEFQSKLAYYQKKGIDIPSEILTTKDFYEL